MKTLLPILALLSIPVLASADSVAWSTYCDNGVEKVRATATLSLPGATSTLGAEMTALNNETCDPDLGYCGFFRDDTAESLGNDEYRYVFEGWTRACLSVDTPSMRGLVFYYSADPGQEPVLRLREFYCFDFEPASIVDNTDCSPLPVASRTWGAIKALYR